jgi:hypothetical protein
VSPHVAMGLGPYLRLSVGAEPAGVWPLRIPGNETVAGGSCARFPERPTEVPPPSDAHRPPLRGGCVQTCRSRGASPFSVDVLRRTGSRLPERSARRFTEKRRSGSRWLSCRGLSMIDPHPNSSMKRSSAARELAARVTENSCWTCQPSQHTALRTTEIEKQPSPSTKPTIHCSMPGLSC